MMSGLTTTSPHEDPIMRLLSTALCTTAALTLTGCYSSPTPPKPATPAVAQKPAASPNTTDKAAEKEAKIKAERAKLSEEDRALVEAQEWCVATDHRLGEMGPPIKVMVKDKPVFLCCDGCEAEALANPDKTLAKVEERKAEKKKKESENK
jgi:hypothetical protein